MCYTPWEVLLTTVSYISLVWGNMTKRTTEHMKSTVLFLRRGKNLDVSSCLI